MFVLCYDVHIITLNFGGIQPFPAAYGEFCLTVGPVTRTAGILT